MNHGRDLAIATIALVAAASLSSYPWEPEVAHTLVTCAVLLVPALVIAPDRSPSWLSPSPRVAVWAPLGAGGLASIAALGLLAGPLEVRGWSLSWGPVLLVLAVPVAEEAFFRGALLRLSRRHPVPLALVSTVLFGALHWKMGWPMVLTMTAIGAVLAALALGSRSIALPTVVHAAFNGLAVGYRDHSLAYVALALLVAGVVAATSWAIPRRTR